MIKEGVVKVQLKEGFTGHEYERVLSKIDSITKDNNIQFLSKDSVKEVASKISDDIYKNAVYVVHYDVVPYSPYKDNPALYLHSIISIWKHLHSLFYVMVEGNKCDKLISSYFTHAIDVKWEGDKPIFYMKSIVGF